MGSFSSRIFSSLAFTLNGELMTTESMLPAAITLIWVLSVMMTGTEAELMTVSWKKDSSKLSIISRKSP